MMDWVLLLQNHEKSNWCHTPCCFLKQVSALGLCTSSGTLLHYLFGSLDHLLSGLCSGVIFSVRPSLAALFKIAACCPPHSLYLCLALPNPPCPQLCLIFSHSIYHHLKYNILYMFIWFIISLPTWIISSLRLSMGGVVFVTLYCLLSVQSST